MTNNLNKNLFSTSNAMENEIIKQEDVQYGYDSAIANIATFFQSCIAQDAPCLDGDVPITDDKGNVIKKNVVIGGKVKPYIGGQGTTNFNIAISPLFAYNANTNQAVAKLEETKVPIHPGNVERYTVCIRASTKEDNVSLYNSASRAFNEPSTGDVSHSTVPTRVQVELIAEVREAPQEQEDSNLCDKDWIKLAEIVIPSGVTDMNSKDVKIYNITAHTTKENNDNWKSGIDRTYNPDYFTSQVARFLKNHDFTGDHRNGVIENRHLDKTPYGTDGTSANTLPIGGENNDVKLQIHGENVGKDGTGFGVDTCILEVIRALSRNVNGSYPYANTVFSRFSSTDGANIKIVQEVITDDIKENITPTTNPYQGNIGRNALLIGQSDERDNGFYIRTDDKHYYKKITGAADYVNMLFILADSKSINKKECEIYYVRDDEGTLKDNGGALHFEKAFFTSKETPHTLAYRDGIGNIRVSGTPKNDNDAVNKNYADSNVYAAMFASIPCGFVYIQLPDMESPQKLWPWTNWDDVTARYKGAIPFYATNSTDLTDPTVGQTQIWERKEGTDDALSILGPYDSIPDALNAKDEYGNNVVGNGRLFIVQNDEGTNIYLRTNVNDDPKHPCVHITSIDSKVTIIKGDKGEKGDRGEQGPQGIQGEVGPKGMDGKTGAAAGFSSATVAVDSNVGVPSAEVSISGDDTQKVLHLIFHNLKGEKGDITKINGITFEYEEDGGSPTGTADIIGGDTEKTLHFVLKNLRGGTGATGAAAGFGDIEARIIQDGTDTPSVQVDTMGPDTQKDITFTFSNLKGEKGDAGTGFCIARVYESKKTMDDDFSTCGLPKGSCVVISSTTPSEDSSSIYIKTDSGWEYVTKWQGDTGATGAAAGFGSVTATIDSNIGTPQVAVDTSGDNTQKNIAFAFSNIKGEKGDKGDTGEVSIALLNEKVAYLEAKIADLENRINGKLDLKFDKAGGTITGETTFLNSNIIQRGDGWLRLICQDASGHTYAEYGKDGGGGLLFFYKPGTDRLLRMDTQNTTDCGLRVLSYDPGCVNGSEIHLAEGDGFGYRNFGIAWQEGQVRSNTLDLWANNNIRIRTQEDNEILIAASEYRDDGEHTGIQINGSSNNTVTVFGNTDDDGIFRVQDEDGGLRNVLTINNDLVVDCENINIQGNGNIYIPGTVHENQDM